MSDAADARRTARPATRWLPVGVLALGLAVTAGIGVWSHRADRAEARERFERRVESFGQALAGQLQSYTDTLPGLRVLGVLRHSGSDAEFRHYAEAISLQRRYPGLALTFVAQRVTAEQRDDFVAQVRNDRSLLPGGHPEFDIRPPGARPVYMVLRHGYPNDPSTFGYDIYDPSQSYRAAVDEAIDDGGYVATGPLLLARDRFKLNQPALTSVVIRAATYNNGTTPATPEARRAAARGVVGISFVVASIVKSVWPAELAGSVLRITDPRAAREGRPSLLFDSAWLANTAAAASGASGAPKAPTAATAPNAPVTFTLPVANRVWDISVAQASSSQPIGEVTTLLLLLGGAFSALGAVMTRSLVGANIRAEAQVAEGLAALRVERDNLARSEGRYRMLFENSLDAVLKTRPNGEVLAANPAACRMFGRSEAQMRALGRSALVDPTDLRLAVLVAHRSKHGHAAGLCRMLRADGSPFEAEVTAGLYVDDDGQKVSSIIVRDVTERQTLAAHRAQLAAILDATPDFVGSSDPQGRNLFLNRAGRRMLGRGDHEDLSSLRITDCHPPWAARLILEEGIPAATRDGAWTGRTAIRCADGSEIPVSQVVICHRDDTGQVTYLSTIARDLRELEQALAERQALELRMLESQKMESIGTLAGGVAHDFNNVLAAILGNIALARADLPDTHPTQHNLQLVEQSAVRGRALVQQILTFSRRSPQERSVLSLHAVVQDAVSLLRTALPPTARVDLALPETPLYVLGDATRLQQVVLNLCNNAWQALAGQPGLITVRLCAALLPTPGSTDTPLALAELPPGRYAQLCVGDDGMGMDAATQARVFEPFFTTKPVGQGTGIGLSVVHGIVAASGGAVTVHSQPGQGSTFSVYLPLADVAAPVAPDTPAPAPSRLSTAQARGRVLYIDDDEVMTITMKALLERAGHRVTSLHSAAQGLQTLREQPQAFDVVVTDHNMPDMSGLDMIVRLRPLAPHLPVVITSGYVTESLRADALAAGAAAVLSKEFSVERLTGVLDEILARRG